jgi:hypothetical protein
MLSKPIELPPDVARRFLEDMRAFFAEKNERAPLLQRAGNCFLIKSVLRCPWA